MFVHPRRNGFSASCGAKELLLADQVKKTTLSLKVIDKRNVYELIFVD